jgi:hypothetical protein
LSSLRTIYIRVTARKSGSSIGAPSGFRTPDPPIKRGRF